MEPTPSSYWKLQVHPGRSTEQVHLLSHCDPPATPSCFLFSLPAGPSTHCFLSQGDHLGLGQPFFFLATAPAVSRSGTLSPGFRPLHYTGMFSYLLPWLGCESFEARTVSC